MWALCYAIGFVIGSALVSYAGYVELKKQRALTEQAEAERDVLADLLAQGAVVQQELSEALCAAQLFLAADRQRWLKVEQLITPKRRTKEAVH